ncbi:MAG: tRNA (adenosine(37)-N6)-threonylcarbamoyltransferase complex dimerization subunit type 1 TsaB [Bdellovibrionales bacterium]|nr:tRNA (adenosine(37)-N6)-threonylcarbamoyltransferase complex dimerization subunit type 1 TsaB [Bdellovibrionales bacterium]
MLLLSISTSTSFGSICLHDGKVILHEDSWHLEKSHAEVLGPRIQLGLDAIKQKASDISVVACDIGPGSFTGVRIGVSTAKAFAYANNIPVIAVDSLRLLAEPIKEPIQIVSMRDAQRQEVYAAVYKRDSDGIQEVATPQLMSLEQLEKSITSPTIVVGDGYEVLKPNLSKTLDKFIVRDSKYLDHPSATVLSGLSLVHLKLNKTLEWKLLEPLYIRLSAAEEKLVKGELKRHV